MLAKCQRQMIAGICCDIKKTLCKCKMCFLDINKPIPTSSITQEFSQNTFWEHIYLGRQDSIATHLLGGKLS